MTDTIVHDEAASRYVIHVDDEEAGFAEYKRDGDTWVFHHTEVKPQYKGRGLAGKVVGHALDEAVAHNGKIVAECSYVAAFIGKNSQYQEHVKSEES